MVRRKIVVRFGMGSTAIAGVAVYLNPDNVRVGGIAAGAEPTAAFSVPLKDGERFVPTSIMVDLCTAPGVGETATYQLRRAVAAGALGNNGPTLVIPAAGTAGRAAMVGAASYGPSDRMSLGVTGSGGAAAHTSTARVEGYIIGRGR